MANLIRDEELERNLSENDSYKEEKRSADDTGSNLGEEVGDLLTVSETWGDWQSWHRRGCHYSRNSRGVRKRTERQLPALRDILKKKLLEETAKVDKGWRSVNLKHAVL